MPRPCAYKVSVFMRNFQIVPVLTARSCPTAAGSSMGPSPLLRERAACRHERLFSHGSGYDVDVTIDGLSPLTVSGGNGTTSTLYCFSPTATAYDGDARKRLCPTDRGVSGKGWRVRKGHELSAVG